MLCSSSCVWNHPKHRTQSRARTTPKGVKAVALRAWLHVAGVQPPRASRPWRYAHGSTNQPGRGRAAERERTDNVQIEQGVVAKVMHQSSGMRSCLASLWQHGRQAGRAFAAPQRRCRRSELGEHTPSPWSPWRGTKACSARILTTRRVDERATRAHASSAAKRAAAKRRGHTRCARV